MEKLEKYIIENRADFDQAVPSLKVWAEIDKTLEKRNGRRVFLWKCIRVAAAVAVLVVSGVVGGAFFTGQFDNQHGAVAQLAPEHAELEQYYTHELAQKTKQLVSLQHDGINKVQEDLARLDETFLELMQEYKKLPPGSGAPLIQAMLENYQTKLDILERVLDKVHHNNPTIEFNQELPNQQIQEEDDTGISI